jgi:hypothetical protein
LAPEALQGDYSPASGSDRRMEDGKELFEWEKYDIIMKRYGKNDIINYEKKGKMMKPGIF